MHVLSRIPKLYVIQNKDLGPTSDESDFEPQPIEMDKEPQLLRKVPPERVTF